MKSRFLYGISYFSGAIRSLGHPTHLKLGAKGERIAKCVLERSGMEFLTKNFRYGKSEIDLIFREGDVLCFIEVKTRSSPLFSPGTAVDYFKKKRIVGAGFNYALKHGLTGCRRRFDIVEIIFRNGRLSEVHHIRNAFGPR